MVIGIDKNLHYQVQDNGTVFQVECKLRELDGIRKECKPGESLICHLQLALHEKVKLKGKKVQHYSWKIAFPLLLID